MPDIRPELTPEESQWIIRCFNTKFRSKLEEHGLPYGLQAVPRNWRGFWHYLHDQAEIATLRQAVEEAPTHHKEALAAYASYRMEALRGEGAIRPGFLKGLEDVRDALGCPVVCEKEHGTYTGVPVIDVGHKDLAYALRVFLNNNAAMRRILSHNMGTLKCESKYLRHLYSQGNTSRPAMAVLGSAIGILESFRKSSDWGTFHTAMITDEHMLDCLRNSVQGYDPEKCVVLEVKGGRLYVSGAADIQGVNPQDEVIRFLQDVVGVAPHKGHARGAG